jgi:hypothetical protein
MEKTVQVELVSASDKKSRGEVQAKYYEQKERRKRALKGLGICWGIGLFCVIIPLAHFILVPSFLLAGPIAAFFMYMQIDMILGGSGTCPVCGKPFAVARTRIQWPINDVCSACHNSVKIYPLENATLSPSK